jgi:uncharacterized protein YbgA (DUF1722 family)/uncharacterized protein YbbK (DUF523 family)
LCGHPDIVNTDCGAFDTYNPRVSDDRPRIGISACLLGQPVRYDGGHKRDRFLLETFGRHVDWVPVCPEVEAGFGAPRESMRLVLVRPRRRDGCERYEPSNIALVSNEQGADLTSQLTIYALRKVEGLARAHLSGFILKEDSPSCGMERVKVYTSAGRCERAGRGLFAEALMSRLPNLPVEEEGRLGDPGLRENFIERVFAYGRLRALFGRRWSDGEVVRFHTAHKLTLMAHSPSAYRALGRLVAAIKSSDRAGFSGEYQSRFMGALSVVATPARHANVLHHMLGYISCDMAPEQRREVLEAIEGHRQGTMPLIVPMALMRHHVRRLGVDYLLGQTYVEPDSRELSLRNHV